MNHLIKQNYDFETGPYVDANGAQVVAVDLVNYSWNDDKQLPEVVDDPKVIYRKLIFDNKLHERYEMKLSLFKEKYTKQ